MREEVAESAQGSSVYMETGTGAMDRMVVLAKALSDPIRVRMVRLLADGRAVCGLPTLNAMNVPGSGETDGICVCEFQEAFQLGQSKVSYHLRILKDAGLVVEDARGKWSFYSLNRRSLRELTALLQGEFRV